MWSPDTIPDGPFIYINKEEGDIRKLFKNVTKAGQVNNQFFRENGLLVFLCTNPESTLKEIRYGLLIRFLMGPLFILTMKRVISGNFSRM